MRKYRITLMNDDGTLSHSYVECSMSLVAQYMACGWLDNDKSAMWVKVEDDNGKMIVTYFQR